MIFKLKQFDLKQTDSLQKMGSDSMLLGASVKGNFNQILDVGTGTGILALMMAQKNLDANVLAIEPHVGSFNEAQHNFQQSKFKDRLNIVNCKLQDLKVDTQFDLIISNPPYYENSTLSETKARNSARHTIELPIYEFYKFSAEFLSKSGTLHLIFPSDLVQKHINSAKHFNLYPHKIIDVVKENKKSIRQIISYQFGAPLTVAKDEIIISLTNGKYSKKYIELTKDFYAHDLSKK